MEEDVTLDYFEESFNEKLHQSYLEITFPNLNKSQNENLDDLRIQEYEINDESVENIISSISVENFNYQSTSDDLIQELKEFIKIPIFKFISKGLEDVEVSKLINKIENDISSKTISGDISDIIDFYFENYKILKRKISLNYYLNQIIQSQSFILLTENYPTEYMINAIDKVRNDIDMDKTTEKNKIYLKLKDYLMKEKIKQRYFNQMEKVRLQINIISEKSGLTTDEVEDIFNEIEMELNNDIYFDSLKNHFNLKVRLKIESNQSESRIKLNNVVKNIKNKDEFKFDDSYLDEVCEEIGELIYQNKIRSDDITEKLINDKLWGILWNTKASSNS